MISPAIPCKTAAMYIFEPKHIYAERRGKGSMGLGGHGGFRVALGYSSVRGGGERTSISTARRRPFRVTSLLQIGS